MVNNFFGVVFFLAVKKNILEGVQKNDFEGDSFLFYFFWRRSKKLLVWESKLLLFFLAVKFFIEGVQKNGEGVPKLKKMGRVFLFFFLKGGGPMRGLELIM